MSPITELIGGAKAYGWSGFSLSTAFESIATAVGTGSSATITFSSIPSTYTSLQFRILGKTSDTSATALQDIKVYFNGINSGTGYAFHRLRGDGSTATAAGSASQTEIGIDAPIPTSNSSYANMMGVGIVDIHDYASTTKNKTLRAISGCDRNGSGQIILSSGLFANTSAITSVSFLLGNSGHSWTTTSTISLYGIKGA